MVAMAAMVMPAPMAQMQLWPDQLAEMERTVEPEALAAKVAKAVLAVRAQKLVLIQPAATAAMEVQAHSRATVAVVRPVLLLLRLARLVTTVVQAATLAQVAPAAKVVQPAPAEAQQRPAQTATAATVARAVWAVAVQAVDLVRREPMQAAVLATWRLLVLPAAMVAMVASEVPRDPSVALVVRAASPESELMVATAEMPVQEEAEATAVRA
jgi:hypothetical protein